MIAYAVGQLLPAVTDDRINLPSRVGFVMTRMSDDRYALISDALYLLSIIIVFSLVPCGRLISWLLYTRHQLMSAR